MRRWLALSKQWTPDREREGWEGKAKEGKESNMPFLASVIDVTRPAFLPFLRFSFPSFL